MKDYLIDYNIGIDKYPNSKYFGKLNDYYTDDIVKIIVS